MVGHDGKWLPTCMRSQNCAFWVGFWCWRTWIGVKYAIIWDLGGQWSAGKQRRTDFFRNFLKTLESRKLVGNDGKWVPKYTGSQKCAFWVGFWCWRTWLGLKYAVIWDLEVQCTAGKERRTDVFRKFLKNINTRKLVGNDGNWVPKYTGSQQCAFWVGFWCWRTWNGHRKSPAINRTAPTLLSPQAGLLVADKYDERSLPCQPKCCNY